jgi:hypothetical protein
MRDTEIVTHSKAAKYRRMQTSLRSSGNKLSPFRGSFSLFESSFSRANSDFSANRRAEFGEWLWRLTFDI